MQQINLYHGNTDDNEMILSFSHMLELMGILLFVLGCLTIYGIYRQYQAQSQLKSLIEEQNVLNKGLSSTQQQIPTQQDREMLLGQIKKLEAEKAQRVKMFSTLSSVQYDGKKGFSDYLMALSKHSQEGTWLTHIHLGKGGEQISLKGKTLDAEKVPLLISSLGEESSFSGKSFEQLRLMAEEESVISFELESAL